MDSVVRTVDVVGYASVEEGHTMAYEVQKWVLFQSARRSLTLGDLVRNVEENFVATPSGAFVYLRDDDDPTRPAVRLSIACDAHVLTDAQNIAERHGANRSDRGEIAKCDARIEIAWQPDEWDDVVDIVQGLDPDLEDLTLGVTWVSNVKELSEGAFK